MNGLRFREHDRVKFNTHSFNASEIVARVIMTLDNGKDISLETRHVPNTDGTSASTFLSGGARVPKAGYVTNAFIGHSLTASGVRRGQTFARLRTLDRDDLLSGKVCSGQIYEGKSLGLGEFEDLLDGKGFLHWVQEANDVSGNVDTTINLALANARRMLRGIVIKYHCSGDSASRTIIATLRDVADTTGPTGFSIDADSWDTPTITLIANQEGVLYVSGNGMFVSRNTNGSIAVTDNSTAPNPLPLAVEQTDTADLIIAVGSGQAADDYDVFLLWEDWLEP